MSSPLSIGDCYLLIQELNKGTNLLRGEAVKGFKRYKAIYRQLTALAGFLHTFVKDHGEWTQSVFAAEVKQIRRLLDQFFSSIKHLKPHLGKGRHRKSILGAITKIKWPHYSENFQQLHSDIMAQFQIIDIKWKFISSQPVPDSTRANKALKNGFVLEDAHGKPFCVEFFAVSSWACLHEFLLQEFPKNNPGKEAIVHRRYLIHKADSDIDILPSRPTKLFSDTVKLRDRIEISIIFPHEEWYETHCPSCRQERSAEYRGTTLTCPNCDLVLRFKDSHDNAPDPLTEIVLQDIQASGRRLFVERFIAKNTHREGCSCPRRNGAYITQQDLHCRIISHAEGLLPSRPISPGQQKSQVRNFARATLCRTQWPDLFHHKKHRKASKRFRDAIAGNTRLVEWLETEDAPILKVAQFINSRFEHARVKQGQLRFLKSVVQACWQEPHIQNWKEFAMILGRYLHHVGEEMAEFEAPILELRCLLWIRWNILNMEADILHSCSVLLNRWSVPEGYTREPTPLAVKLLTLPHAALIIPLWRLTVDVAGDAINMLHDKKPMHLPLGVRLMVQRLSSISIQFYLDDHLRNYFSGSRVAWPACQDWMEAIMRSKGLKLESAGVYSDLRRIETDG